MIYEIAGLIIYGIGLLTGEYLAGSMGLLTLLVLIQTHNMKGGKNK